jgi:hypothetical protein
MPEGVQTVTNGKRSDNGTGNTCNIDECLLLFMSRPNAPSGRVLGQNKETQDLTSCSVRKDDKINLGDICSTNDRDDHTHRIVDVNLTDRQFLRHLDTAAKQNC